MRLSRRIRVTLLASSSLLLFGAFALTQSFAKGKNQKAHEHGAAQVSIAVQGKDAELTAEIPGADIFGFEHPPRTAQEKQTVANTLQKLRQHPEEMFLVSDASCHAVDANVKAAQEEGLNEKAAPSAKDVEAHADVDATYRFSCKSALAGQTLRLGLLKQFPRIKAVKVQVISDAKQTQVVVKSAQDIIKL